MVIFYEGEHARAAVEAARAIQRRAAEIGAELADRFDPVAMHVGINTGPALLGATKIEGSARTRWTYTASGMTTNIAARLSAQAGDGEIVLSEPTRQRLGADLAVEDLGVRGAEERGDAAAVVPAAVALREEEHAGMPIKAGLLDADGALRRNEDLMLIPDGGTT
jgi:class 3 adenylate cyclase